MRKIFRLPGRGAGAAALALLCIVPFSAARAGTWENAFGNRNLDDVANQLLQSTDAGQRQQWEQQIGAALQQEDERAVYVTGVLQYAGTVAGIPANASAGLRQIQRAARDGIPEARARLATLLLAGAGGIDAVQTRQWLDQIASTSATASYADAQLWSRGLGGPANACRAYQLLQIAQRQNADPDGQLSARLAQTGDACRGGGRSGVPPQPAGLTANDLARLQQMSRSPVPGTGLSGGQGAASQPGSVAGAAAAAGTTVGTAAGTAVVPPADAAAGTAQPRGWGNEGTGPAASAAPGDGPHVSMGESADAGTYRMDLLLAMLSYAVYSNASTLAAAQQAVADAQSKLGEVQSDPTLDPIVKARELGNLNRQLASADGKLASEQAAQAVRAQAAAAGAQFVPFPEIAARAEAGHVYFEAWRLPQGPLAIVFRGTANAADIATDAQIGMTPEVAKELYDGYKASVRLGGVVTGIGDSAVKDLSDGRLTTQSAGRPAAFAVADTVVSSIVRRGVPASDIVVAGHSLGGGYAQYAGILNGVGTIVGFNPAPLNSRQIADLHGHAAVFQPKIRYHISQIDLPGRQIADPVSQVTGEILRQPGMTQLRVFSSASEHIDRVCADFDDPSYQAFAGKLQGFVTSTTVKTVSGGQRLGKLAATAAGGGDGVLTASNNRQGAAVAGGQVGRGAANAVVATRNCLLHPFLCSAAAAAGGVASVAASELTPRLWLLLSAHSIRNLEESMAQGGLPVCSLPAQVVSALAAH